MKYKLLAGGGMLKIVNQTVAPALRNLGYTPAEIEKIIAHIDRYDTIEDVLEEDGTTVASGLKPEDFPVFDCAFKPHRGTRIPALSWSHPDDGRSPAVPQRRHLQDRQSA